MAESKFDKLFETARAEPAAVPEEVTPPGRRVGQVALAPMRAAKVLGRPPGKRSDPAWKQFSVLLKKETQRTAANILRENEEGLDFSGLVQNLVETWIKRKKP